MNTEQAMQATDRAQLRRLIMDSRIAKNEQEHWAKRRIESLERVLGDILRDAPSVDCNSFHHAKPDQHEHVYPCPVMDRYEYAMTEARKLNDNPTITP